MTTTRFDHVLVTGGAGYVGAVLVPKLLRAGYRVSVLDLFLYGEDVFDSVKPDPKLRLIKGDLRHLPTVEATLANCNVVIHLACISNDPSFELDPALGKSINLDAFRPLVRAAKSAGVRRFIYASSSSVYGIKEGVSVTEELPLAPLTDYSRFKAECERILYEEREPNFVTMTLLASCWRRRTSITTRAGTAVATCAACASAATSSTIAPTTSRSAGSPTGCATPSGICFWGRTTAAWRRRRACSDPTSRRSNSSAR